MVILMSKDKGTKHNEGKPQLSLVPRALLVGVARVMEKGVEKYGRDNWRRGFLDTDLIDAALRHLTAMAEGEVIDDGPGGTGEPHAACVAANMGFLLHQYGQAETSKCDECGGPGPLKPFPASPDFMYCGTCEKEPTGVDPSTLLQSGPCLICGTETHYTGPGKDSWWCPTCAPTTSSLPER